MTLTRKIKAGHYDIITEDFEGYEVRRAVNGHWYIIDFNGDVDLSSESKTKRECLDTL